MPGFSLFPLRRGERWGRGEDAADATAPQARKIIFRAVKRIKKVEGRVARAEKRGHLHRKWRTITEEQRLLPEAAA